jgi:hypothetical protein
VMLTFCVCTCHVWACELPRTLLASLTSPILRLVSAVQARVHAQCSRRSFLVHEVGTSLCTQSSLSRRAGNGNAESAAVDLMSCTDAHPEKVSDLRESSSYEQPDGGPVPGQRAELFDERRSLVIPFRLALRYPVRAVPVRALSCSAVRDAAMITLCTRLAHMCAERMTWHSVRWARDGAGRTETATGTLRLAVRSRAGGNSATHIENADLGYVAPRLPQRSRSVLFTLLSLTEWKLGLCGSC